MRFLERLDEAVRLSEEIAAKGLSEGARRDIRRAASQAQRRLFLLDYDGTLVSFSPDRTAALPTKRVFQVLNRLLSDAANQVVLVSGRPRADLEKWFGGLGLRLVAEHGAWIREVGDSEWRSSFPIDEGWKDRVRPVIERFLDRVPGSSLEEKDFALAWHYRAADAESGTVGAKELVEVLTALTANLDLKVFPGDKVVEIRRAGANKGTYFTTHLARDRWDFILAAGDDWTDEALFASLPPEAFSIRVGFGVTAARFSVEGAEDILALLESLASG